MEIPSTTNFDFRYKEAIKFLWENPTAIVVLEQGICPHIELPHQTEFIENTIWPVGFFRLINLGLLVEHEGIDPNGNGRKKRNYWTLDRTKAQPLVTRKRGRPETVLGAGKVLEYLDALLTQYETGQGITEEQVNKGRKMIADWRQGGQ